MYMLAREKNIQITVYSGRKMAHKLYSFIQLLYAQIWKLHLKFYT